MKPTLEDDYSKRLNEGYQAGFTNEQPKHKDDTFYMDGYRIGLVDGGARRNHLHESRS